MSTFGIKSGGGSVRGNEVNLTVVSGIEGEIV
jgi:hypothetical protein